MNTKHRIFCDIKIPYGEEGGGGPGLKATVFDVVLGGQPLGVFDGIHDLLDR